MKGLKAEQCGNNERSSLNMDPVVIGVGVPAIAGIATLGFLGWNREMRRRQEKQLDKARGQRSVLLDGAVRLRAESDRSRRAEGRGQVTLLVTGTFGARLLPSILKEFVDSGTDSCVGPIFLLELDQYELDMCLRSLPPAFLPKVIVARCPTFSVGMGGDSIRDVLSAEEEWRQDVMAGTRQWLARVQAESESGLLFALLSPGGSAALGYWPMRAYHERFPRKPIYTVSVLDQKTPVRQRFPEQRQLYSLDDLVRGSILFDNRRFSRRSDTGLAIFIAASTAAQFISDQPLSPANLLAYVFPKEKPGGFATLSTWGEWLPVSRIPPWEDLPEVFYSKAALVEDKAIRGIHEVFERPGLQSAPLDAAPSGNTRLALVAAPIVPGDFKLSARRISDALEDWRSRTDPDLSLQFASVGMRLDPATQEVPIVVAYLTPLAASAREVDALALGGQVDAKFFPEPTPESRIQPARSLMQGVLSAEEEQS